MNQANLLSSLSGTKKHYISTKLLEPKLGFLEWVLLQEKGNIQNTMTAVAQHPQKL